MQQVALKAGQRKPCGAFHVRMNRTSTCLIVTSRTDLFDHEFHRLCLLRLSGHRSHQWQSRRVDITNATDRRYINLLLEALSELNVAQAATSAAPV